ncbi:MAG: hypothetical protein ACI3T9_00255 [Romboutsia timonensis]
MAKLTLEELWKISDGNEYIESVSENGKFIYTKSFYLEINKKLNEGLNPVEAYQALGFDVDKLGKDRAYAACKRAKVNSEKFKKMATDPKYYNGSKLREEMGELTPEEELAYYKSRVIFLEAVNELQKKTPGFPLNVRTSSQNKK